ncbi:MAG: hypothetical protein AAF432_04775 [Planctomycetota bacterium]
MNGTWKKSITTCGIIVSVAIGAMAFAGAPPEYTIVDLGIIDPGDVGVQGLRVSEGGVAVGRTFGFSNQAFSWTQGGGLLPLPNLAPRPFAAANGANDNNIVVGTAAATFFGTNPLPVIWTNGVVAPLPLPVGETIGRANDVNASVTAVGSVDGGIAEQAVMYTGNAGGSAAVIDAVAIDGSTMKTAFSINDDGIVVGIGTDPNNAARNVGCVYNSNTDRLTEVGALPGANGALCFHISNAGHVVGGSMQNQGASQPFIWTETDGMTQIPLPPATSQGSARGVNSDGWAVGTAGGAFAVPFLYDGTTTYAVQALIPVGSGWDLSMNTSSSALGISEDGIIVGTGIFNGETRAYAAIPVDTAPPCPTDCAPDNGDGTFGNGETNIDDLLAVINSFGDPGGPCDSAPDNGDGTFGNNTVNIDDLLNVINNFGQCPA